MDEELWTWTWSWQQPVGRPLGEQALLEQLSTAFIHMHVARTTTKGKEEFRRAMRGHLSNDVKAERHATNSQLCYCHRVISTLGERSLICVVEKDL